MNSYFSEAVKRLPNRKCVATKQTKMKIPMDHNLLNDLPAKQTKELIESMS